MGLRTSSLTSDKLEAMAGKVGCFVYDQICRNPVGSSGPNCLQISLVTMYFANEPPLNVLTLSVYLEPILKPMWGHKEAEADGSNVDGHGWQTWWGAA